MKQTPHIVLVFSLLTGFLSTLTAQISVVGNLNNNGFVDALDGPYVGTATLTYDADSPWPEGTYAWTSFPNLELSIDFPDADGGNGLTFTHDDLGTSPEQVFIGLRDEGFFFANNSDAPDGPRGGSADFVKDATGEAFSSEPIDSATLLSDYRGEAFTYPFYYMIFDSGSQRYEGTYGAAVPEPSSTGVVFAGCLLGMLTYNRLSRRWK